MIHKKLKTNEFKCASCNKIYEKGWTDEENKKEFREHFCREVDETDELVCDDCYKKIMAVNEN